MIHLLKIIILIICHSYLVLETHSLYDDVMYGKTTTRQAKCVALPYPIMLVIRAIDLLQQYDGTFFAPQNIAGHRFATTCTCRKATQNTSNPDNP